MYTINCQGRLFDLSTPQVMGILNLTPDSFYAGSRRQDEAGRDGPLALRLADSQAGVAKSRSLCRHLSCQRGENVR